MKNYKFISIIAFSILLLIGFLFRFHGIFNNQPFWVDEFSSANQAKYIINNGLRVFSSFDKPPFYFENRNITTHLLVALFFKIFGIYEWSARLPIVIIGSLVPLVVFYLARLIYNSRVALGASLLTIFSYFEIVWSRQARGYALQQLFTLLTIFLYIKILKNKKPSRVEYLLLGLLILLGLATHPLFAILAGAIVLHFLFHTKKWSLLASTLIIGIGALIITKQSIYNNLWYYHSFLWREYGLLTFLAICGLASSLALKLSGSSIIALFIALHICVISFMFSPYTSRYLNAIFPLFLILGAFTITQMSDLTLKQVRNNNKFVKVLVPLMLILFIISNGDKFVIKPKQFYSVNHDFREIALIDYSQIYTLMKQKGEFEKGKTAIVETWLDRLHWYMGQEFMNAYELKWNNAGSINGLPTTSPYTIDKNGRKATIRYKKIGFINELSDLKSAMYKYPKGFILIDDLSLPKDIIDYSENNLKKELFLDHSPLDDNPYSIWPTTLYSWGFDSPK